MRSAASFSNPRKNKPGFRARSEVEVGSGALGKVAREGLVGSSRGAPTSQGADLGRTSGEAVAGRWVSNCGWCSPEGELGWRGGREGRRRCFEDGAGGGGVKDDGDDVPGEPVKTSLTLLLGVGPCQALTARL